MGRPGAVTPRGCLTLDERKIALRRLSFWQLTPGGQLREGVVPWREFVAYGEQSGDYTRLMKTALTVNAEYAARANVLPGVHLSLLRAR